MKTEINLEFLKKRPLSSSSLKAFAKSPMHYIHYVTATKKDQPALIFGRLVDVLLFTPGEFESQFSIMPDFPYTKVGYSEKAIWVEANKGKTAIKQDFIDEAKLMIENIKTNPSSKERLDRKISCQKRVTWTDKETGLPMLGILDLEGDDFIADLKTAQSAEPNEFMRAAFNFDYHLQAAIYVEGYGMTTGNWNNYFFIVAEKTEPYAVSVLKADANFIELGKQKFHRLLVEFKYCMDNNLWDNGYEFRAPVGYHQLSLPGYALNQLEK